MQFSELIRRSVQVNGRGAAIVDLGNGARRSYEELACRIGQLAASLRANGVVEGDRVAIISENSGHFIEAFFAIIWCGAIAVPLNFRLTNEELTQQIDDCEPAALFISPRFVDRLDGLNKVRARLKLCVVMAESTETAATVGLGSMVDGRPEVRPFHWDHDDAAAVILYTGGTTGRPKGVMLSQKALIMNAYQSAALLGNTAGMRYAHVAPMFHIGDCAYIVAVTMHAGCHVVIPEFDPSRVVDALARERVTHVALVPTMINRLMAEPGFVGSELKWLANIIYGASTIPESLLRAALEALPGVQFGQSYGQTETATITVLRPEAHVTSGPAMGKLRSAGQPAIGAEVAICTPDGSEAEPGEVGEITVRSQSLMSGYWRNPEATRESVRAGRVHTGDVGYMDEQGFVYIVDRLKDMIITGGENVSSPEVESALHQHPAVLECAVIGVPHAEWGEQVHAVVRLHPDAEVEEHALIAHCRSLIAGYKCPRTIEITADPLPLSGIGKVLKRDLRERIARKAGC